jgi:hypothetical protein
MMRLLTAISPKTRAEERTMIVPPDWILAMSSPEMSPSWRARGSFQRNV